MSQTKRNLNFELLRILSMLMVVTLHLLGQGHGNVLSQTSAFTPQWLIGWGIEALCIVAVNCFILISGYFLSGREADSFSIKLVLRKILLLCRTVWFYVIVLFVFAFSLGLVDLSLSSIITMVTPITGRMYWFVTVYIGLYALHPFLNRLIRILTKSDHLLLIILLVTMTSIIPTFIPISDTFYTGGGTGIAWFIVLYLISAYIRVYGLDGFKKVDSSKRWFLLYFLFSMLILSSKCVITFLTNKYIKHPIGTSIFYGYNSPLCLISSVCLFMCFKNYKTGECKIIRYVSSLTFGVYIIHANPYIRESLWSIFLISSNDNACLFILKVLFIPIIVFVVCVFVDGLRKLVVSLFLKKNKAHM